MRLEAVDVRELKELMVTYNHRPTMVLADDHVGILNRASEILAQEFNIVATANDGISAVRAAMEFKPDILILDIAMPGINGIRVAHEVRRLGLTAKLVFLTVQADPDYIQTAHGIGANYVLKPRMHLDLLLAVKEALAGRSFVSPLPVMTPSARI